MTTGRINQITTTTPKVRVHKDEFVGCGPNLTYLAGCLAGRSVQSYPFAPSEFLSYFPQGQA